MYLVQVNINVKVLHFFKFIYKYVYFLLFIFYQVVGKDVKSSNRGIKIISDEKLVVGKEILAEVQDEAGSAINMGAVAVVIDDAVSNTITANEVNPCALSVAGELMGVKDISGLNVGHLFSENEITPVNTEECVNARLVKVKGTPYVHKQGVCKKIRGGDVNSDVCEKEPDGGCINLLNSSNDSNMSAQSNMTTRSKSRAKGVTKLASTSKSVGSG